MTNLLQSQTRIVSAFLLGEELTKADYAVSGVATDIIAPHVKEREHLKGFAELSADLKSNGMINPIIPYDMKGAIWYQGEANVGRAEQYEILFPSMIEDWREKWKNKFPFYYVQISPFRYQKNPEHQISQKLRDAQRKTLKLPNTGMAVTIDIGNFDNIHPSNKKDVGERLASYALKNDYNQESIASEPIIKSVVDDFNNIYKLILK